MQNNRHFCCQICESLIRRNQTWEQLCSSFCFFFLCLSPSGFKSVLAKNLPKKKKTPLIFSDRLFKEVLSALREAHSIQTAVFSAYYGSNTLMLKTFFKPELNRLNAFVKIAKDALMLHIKSWKTVLKSFTEHKPIQRGQTAYRKRQIIPPARFHEVFILKNGSWMTV